MITFLTATCRRPFAFSCLERFFAAQHKPEPWEWLVCGEDLEGYRFTMGQRVIHRTGPELSFLGLPLPSICANYLRLVREAQTEKFIVLEDDDAPLADFIPLMARLLNEAPLVGLSHARYYHLPSRRWEVLENATWASLACTAFRREVVPCFEQQCRIADPWIDARLWCHWGQTLGLPCRLVRNEGQHVGLKGVEGPGLGLGHSRMLMHHDPDGVVQREWLGEFAGLYVA